MPRREPRPVTAGDHYLKDLRDLVQRLTDHLIPEEDETDTELITEIRHKGGGWYDVEINGEVVRGGLRKYEAEEVAEEIGG